MQTSFEEARAVSNFALTHFSAAKHFSQEAHTIEAKNVRQPFGNFWEEISIYCASSIITAAASIEALINELFITPGDLRNNIEDFDKFFWGSNEPKRRFFFCKGKTQAGGFERKPALAKYKKAVNLLDKTPLSKSDSQYRAAETLIGFRNYLIHFKPLWDEERRNDRLEERLNGLFQTSPYAEENSSFLEQKCMSADCSSWAVQTVVDFVEYFGNKSGLNPQKLSSFK